MSGHHPTTLSPNQPGDADVPLPAHAANYTPLSPLSFIARSADVYTEQLATIHGDVQYSWGKLTNAVKPVLQDWPRWASVRAMSLLSSHLISLLYSNCTSAYP